MIEKSIVFLIVAAAALYLGRRFLRQAQGSGQGCGGGCSGCGGKASQAPCSPPNPLRKRGKSSPANQSPA
ncbi:MAG TPA: FeoB-associated Cys-rich membrane protein [Desulfurivibrionaceae bacterium]|nr:FeoB-associated Cys-rich membrane protein [Desulfurivibrionaceae bacterium]